MDGTGWREGLHAEFGDETTGEGGEVLVGLLGTVPDWLYELV